MKDRKRELRKSRSNLVDMGEGVIALSAWTILKFIMFSIFNKAKLIDMVKNELKGEEYPPFMYELAVIFVDVIVLALMTFIMVITYWIGKSAIKEGKNGKKGIVYVAAAFVFVLLYANSVYTGIMNLINGTPSIFDDAASILVDITTLFAFAGLTISAIKVKLLGE